MAWWSDEQYRNAKVIASVGRSLGASDRDILIALMAAMQESGLRNLNYGDRDSIGLFQQRDAWGTRSQRLDPAQSAQMFFLGGHAGQRGLFDFANRIHMTLSQAAQAVQVSAYPDAYAKHEQTMRQIMGSLGIKGGAAPGSSTTTTTTTTLGDVPGLDALKPGPFDQGFSAPSVTEVNGIGEITADEAGIGEASFENGYGAPLDALQFGSATFDPQSHLHSPSLEDFGLTQHTTTTSSVVGGGGAVPGGDAPNGLIGFAKKFLGTPYVWGGTSPQGFDCSGFVQYVYRKFGINLPRVSADQARSGPRIGLGDLKPGDLVAWDNSSRNNGADHIAIYIGNGMIIEAPRPGSSVQLSHLYDTGRAWGVRINRR